MELPTSPGREASPLAIALLTDIKKGTRDAAKLTEHERLLCTRHLLHEGTLTRYEISQILKVSERTISRDHKKLRAGQELANLILSESDVAEDLMEDAEICIARLKKLNKWKDAFEVKVKLIDTLQSMGILKKVETKLNIKGSLNLIEVLELDRRNRESESPDSGDETSGNGNGHNGHGAESSDRMEPLQN